MLSCSFQIRPAPATLSTRTDFFGNQLCFFTLQHPHTELIVDARSEVVVEDMPRTPCLVPWEDVAQRLPHDTRPQTLDAYQFTFESPRIRMRHDFAEYALASFTPGRPMQEALLDLTARIHNDFEFDAGTTTVRTPAEDVFRKRRGVCQDFAHVQIACLRSIGLAARYVSGYLRTLPPPGKPRTDFRGAPRTPGSLTIYPAAAGSFSRSNPATSYLQTGTSHSPGGATTATSVHCAASSSAAAHAH